MSAWTQTTTAVVSLLVGAGGTFAVSEVGDRWRANRERVRHWEDRRTAAYAEFAVSTKLFVTLLYRTAASFGLDDQTETLPPSPQAEAAFAAALMRREEAFELVRVIGSDAITLAAQAWVQRIYPMRVFVLTGPTDDAANKDEWKRLTREANAARDLFHKQAQAEIRIVN